MKYLAIFLLAVSLKAQPFGLRTNFTLMVNYPTSQITTGMLIKFFWSDAIWIPVSNWTVLTNIDPVIWTNSASTNELTTFKVPIKITPAVTKQFFASSVSNLAGELFSETFTFPAAPRTDTNLRVILPDPLSIVGIPPPPPPHP